MFCEEGKEYPIHYLALELRSKSDMSISKFYFSEVL